MLGFELSFQLVPRTVLRSCTWLDLLQEPISAGDAFSYFNHWIALVQPVCSYNSCLGPTDAP
jgi:hypothetical protein